MPLERKGDMAKKKVKTKGELTKAVGDIVPSNLVNELRRLYLRWLEKHEMHRGEERPLDLILCAD